MNIMSVDVSRLEIRELSYKPIGETLDQLRDTVFVPVIGPMGVGKTTLIDYVAEHYEGFGSAQGFTTRPERPEGETEYRFLPHNQALIDGLVDKVRHGEVVQYHVHPQTGFVYGTEPGDYNQLYSMAAIMASAMEQMRGLPFKDVRPVAIICSPEEFLDRTTRRHMSADERTKRIKEARNSLAWALEQGDSMAWILNKEGDLDHTAKQLVNYAQHGIDPSASHEEGEVLLERLWDE